MRIKQCFASAMEREIAKIMSVESKDVKVQREAIGITTDKMVAVEVRVENQHLLAYMTFYINNGHCGAKLHRLEFYNDTQY